MESRGTHASGFAYFKDGRWGYHKEPKPGGQLSLKSLPRDAKQVILHTRFTTHGSESDNQNNHPVLSLDGSVMLTHNGVCYNYSSVLKGMGLADFGTIPQVDSFAIAQTIATAGVGGLEELDGYASLAWMNKETDGVIHLARPKDSPVSYAKLIDGSIVYASTEYILGVALSNADLRWFGGYPDQFVDLDEGDYLMLDGGEIVDRGYAPWGDDFSTPMWKGQTSGGRGAYAVDSSGYASFGWQRGFGEWDDDTPAGVTDGRAVVFDDYADDESVMVSAPNDTDQFYLIDHDGDYHGASSYKNLAVALRWYGDMHPDDDSLVKAGVLKWVNHFRDIGHIDEKGGLVSWRDDPSFLDDELSNLLSESDYSMIRDGLNLLHAMV